MVHHYLPCMLLLVGWSLHHFRIDHLSTQFSPHPRRVHKVLDDTCESVFFDRLLAFAFDNSLMIPWHQPYHAVHGDDIYGDGWDCTHGYEEIVQNVGMVQYSIRRKEQR